MKLNLILLLFVCFSCSSKTVTTTEKDTEEKMLIGEVLRKDFSHSLYAQWYNENYNSYEVDMDLKEDISSKMSNYNIEIYFGSWCSDSQRELPAFFKIIDEYRIEDSAIKMYGLDRDKIEPGNNQKDKNIEYVPTFIFLRDGREIGRIIESPETFLERDILNILNSYRS